jgi:hypothetical protein
VRDNLESVLSSGGKRSLAVLLASLVVSCGGENGPVVGVGSSGQDGEAVGTPDDSATGVAANDGRASATSDAADAEVEDGETPDASEADAFAYSDAAGDSAWPGEASVVDATIVDATVSDATVSDATVSDATVADSSFDDATDTGVATEDASRDATALDATARDASSDASDAGTANEDASRDATTPDATTAHDAATDAAEGGSVAAEEGGTEVGPGWSPGDGGLALQIVSDGGALDDGGSPEVVCIDLATQDLALDSTRGVLYVTVSGSSSVYGNNVVRINPANLAVTGSVFVGSNPDALAVTDDAASLYVGIDGAFSVVAVDLASGDVGTPVYLGASTSEGARFAGEIRAVPGSDTQYVVSRRTSDSDPSFAGLALYEGATLLGEWNGFVGGESIAFTSQTVLYGYNNENTDFDLYEFTVNSSGFTEVSDTMGLIQGFNAEIESQGGWLFATTGQALNGATDQPVGQYDATGPVWPDPDGTDVWYLDASASPPVLSDFDRTLFTLKRSFTLSGSLTGSGASSLVAWSSTGLAFRTPTAVCVVTVPPG